MSATLTDDLLRQLQGAPLQRIAGQLGMEPAQAERAVAGALPLLMGALGRNASRPQGADALFGALQRDHAGTGGLGDVLGAVLGGGGQGERILGHIFGAQEPVAAERVGTATGVGSGAASQLMRILAPIVMAYLAKRMLGSDASPQQLSATLGDERRQLRTQGGPLGGLLDQDGDGDTDASDLIGLAGRFLR